MSRLAKLGIPLLLLAGSVGFSLQSNQFGKRALATIHGFDWVCHADQSELYLLEARTDPGFSYLEHARRYPPIAYLATDAAARALGVAPIASIQILAGLLAVLICFVYAMRVASLEDRAGLIALAASLGLYSGLAFLGGTPGGMLRHNFFYAHFIGIALALGAELLILSFARTPWQTALSSLILGLGLLPLVHLEPALWLAGTGCLMALSQSKSIRQATAISAGFLAALVGVMALLPSAKAMVEISQNNGGLFFATFPGASGILEPSRALLILMIAVLAGTLYWLSRDVRGRWRGLLWNHAGFLVIVLLVLAQLLVLKTLHLGSSYAVKKHVYLLGFEMPLVLLTLLGRAEPTRALRRPPVRAGLFAAVFLLGLPFYSYPVDQSALLSYRSTLLRIRDQVRAGPRVFPQFPDLEPEQNVYLAMGVLGYHWGDPAIFDWWLQHGTHGDRPLRLESYLSHP